ncbi:hypothetical protein [Dactylosporangium darangshiense]|uniref:hypothetical protein n=1 Tax=Dactylosporangium darangshiense TaxID=579108 RepID=UPI00363FC13E
MTAIATDMSLRDGWGYQAGGADPLPTRHLVNYQRQQLGLADDAPGVVFDVADFGVVRGLLAGAGVGARGVVVVQSSVRKVSHAFNVVRDVRGVTFLDGQAGRLAVAPGSVVAVKFLPMTVGLVAPAGVRVSDGSELVGLTGADPDRQPVVRVAEGVSEPAPGTADAGQQAASYFDAALVSDQARVVVIGRDGVLSDPLVGGRAGLNGVSGGLPYVGRSASLVPGLVDPPATAAPGMHRVFRTIGRRLTRPGGEEQRPVAGPSSAAAEAAADQGGWTSMDLAQELRNALRRGPHRVPGDLLADVAAAAAVDDGVLRSEWRDVPVAHQVVEVRIPVGPARTQLERLDAVRHWLRGPVARVASAGEWAVIVELPDGVSIPVVRLEQQGNNPEIHVAVLPRDRGLWVNHYATGLAAVQLDHGVTLDELYRRLDADTMDTIFFESGELNDVEVEHGSVRYAPWSLLRSASSGEWMTAAEFADQLTPADNDTQRTLVLLRPLDARFVGNHRYSSRRRTGPTSSSLRESPL